MSASKTCGWERGGSKIDEMVKNGLRIFSLAATTAEQTVKRGPKLEDMMNIYMKELEIVSDDISSGTSSSI